MLIIPTQTISGLCEGKSLVAGVPVELSDAAGKDYILLGLATVAALKAEKPEPQAAVAPPAPENAARRTGKPRSRP